jgi:hypothetical protein
MIKIKSLSVYGKNFYERNCKNCKWDNNKDADPTCKILIKIMEGGKPPSKCEEFRRDDDGNS